MYPKQVLRLSSTVHPLGTSPSTGSFTRFTCLWSSVCAHALGIAPCHQNIFSASGTLHFEVFIKSIYNLLLNDLVSSFVKHFESIEVYSIQLKS